MAPKRKAVAKAPEPAAEPLDPRVATAIYEFLLFNNDADTAAMFKPKLPEGLEDENIELLEKFSSLSNLKRDIENHGVSALQKCVQDFDAVVSKAGWERQCAVPQCELRVQCVLFHLSSGTGTVKQESKEAKKKLTTYFPKGGNAKAGSKELTVRPHHQRACPRRALNPRANPT